MVPPAPPLAEMVVLPQNVPAPLPVTAAGREFTLTTRVEIHPDGLVYVTVVEPPDRPESTPELLIVPTAVLLLTHVPPDIVLDNVVLLPWQTLLPPVMAAVVFTVTTADEEHPADVE